MDPLTHSFVGAALSRTGLHRTTPLATATLVLAANAPDIDIVAQLRGSYASLALRRGVTHGPLALLLLPLVVTAIVLFFDRTRRRGRDPAAAPARAGPVLGLAALGVLTHAPLDWLNTYGVRLLSPFSDRWFYGDTLFIIDPWIWLLLATVVVAHTRSRRGWIGWGALGLGVSVLVLVVPLVPVAAKLVWSIAIVAAALLVARAHRRDTRPNEQWARVALACVALYVGAMIASDAAARSYTARTARARGIAVEDVMVAPVPANPFAADVVVRTANAYQLGSYRWFDRSRIRWSDSIPFGPRNELVLATLRLRQVRDFLRWSRFPYVAIEEDEQGRMVRWGDARYPDRIGGGLAGLTIRVDTMARPQRPRP